MDLFDTTWTFFEEKWKTYKQLGDIEWKQDVMFFYWCHEPFTCTEFVSTMEGQDFV